jgi:hypothetical protein
MDKVVWMYRRTSMNAVINQQLRVDGLGSIHFQHPQLQPGMLVEVTIRAASANEAQPRSTFLDVLGQTRIDAPADYSVHFQHTLG